MIVVHDSVFFVVILDTRSHVLENNSVVQVLMVNVLMLLFMFLTIIHDVCECVHL